jgi:hypothetical protein
MSKCAICRRHTEYPTIWQGAKLCNECVPKERKAFTYDVVSEDVILQVVTRSPEKWMLIDRETGQTYQGSTKGYWDRLDPVIKDIDKNNKT